MKMMDATFEKGNFFTSEIDVVGGGGVSKFRWSSAVLIVVLVAAQVSAVEGSVAVAAGCPAVVNGVVTPVPASGDVLAGCNLQSANLAGLNLRGVDFTNADLFNANLTGANVASARFRGANLSLAKFASSNMAGVSSGDVIGAPSSLPSEWEIAHGYLMGPGADLSAVNFSWCDQSAYGWKPLSTTSLAGADFSRAVLDQCRLADGYGGASSFEGAKFVSASLFGTSLLFTTLKNADFTDASLRGTNFMQSSLSGARFSGALWDGVILEGGDLAGADFSGCDCKDNTEVWTYRLPFPLLPDGFFFWVKENQGSVVRGAFYGPGVRWRNDNFAGRDFTSFNFSQMDFENSDFSGANLTATNFSSSSLQTVVLTNANVSGADFTNASLWGVRSGGLIGSPVRLPVSWATRGGYLLGPGADLSSTNFVTLDFSGLDLSEANLSNVLLDDVNLEGVSLAKAQLTEIQSRGLSGTPSELPGGWKLLKGYLVGPAANLAGTNLEGVDLSSVNLAQANLNGVKSGGILGTPSALPPNWLLRNGYLVGPGADLTGANLNGADLTGANLNGADLTGANLNGVKSGGILGTPRLPPNWLLGNGYLLGPDAQLAGADLAGVDLSELDLSGVSSGDVTIDSSTLLPTYWRWMDGYLLGPAANLANAQLADSYLLSSKDYPLSLKGANLIGADLSNAIFTGIDLSGADLSDANLTSTQFRNSNLSNVVLSNALVDNTRWSGSTCPDSYVAEAHENSLCPSRIDKALKSHSLTSSILYPFRDNYYDETRIRVASYYETFGAVRVYSSTGVLIRSWALNSSSQWDLQWTGKDSNDRVAAPGSYQLKIYLSVNGEFREAANRWLTIRKSQTSITSLRRSARTVYQGGDPMVLQVAVALPSTGTLKIKSGSRVVRTFQLPIKRSWSVRFNGRFATGKRMPTGNYTAVVTVKGGEGTARSSSTTLRISR
jgi:uncharacterized protein YjbI with pentapeptide repeats